MEIVANTNKTASKNKQKRIRRKMDVYSHFLILDQGILYFLIAFISFTSQTFTEKFVTLRSCFFFIWRFGLFEVLTASINCQIVDIDYSMNSKCSILKMQQKTSIFQRPVWVAIFALTAAVVWGWAYPLIKMGFAEFGITPEMLPSPVGEGLGVRLTGSKMLFVGIRFFLSGMIIHATLAMQILACSKRPRPSGRSAD